MVDFSIQEFNDQLNEGMIMEENSMMTIMGGDDGKVMYHLLSKSGNILGGLEE